MKGACAGHKAYFSPPNSRALLCRISVQDAFFLAESHCVALRTQERKLEIHSQHF